MSSLAPPSILEVLLSKQAAGTPTGPSGVSPGKAGSGQQTPVRLAAPLSLAGDDAVAPQEFGAEIKKAFERHKAVVQSQGIKFDPSGT